MQGALEGTIEITLAPFEEMNFFHTEQRLAAARQDVLAFTDGKDLESSFSTVEAAEAWLRRVQHWIGNLRRDLVRDSTPAPGKSETRWLLFQTSSMQISAGDGSVTCSLCKRCRSALGRVTPAKKRQPRGCLRMQERMGSGMTPIWKN